MGRYAQARRRGGSPPPAAAPRPALIVATDLEGGSIQLTFNGDVTANPGAVPDGTSLVEDGNLDEVTAVANTGDNVITIAQGVDPAAGVTLTWAAQPPWITTPIDLTTSVLVT